MIENVKFGHSPLFYPAVLPALFQISPECPIRTLLAAGFTVVALWFVINTWITQPGPSTVAFLIIASGIPVYYLWRRIR